MFAYCIPQASEVRKQYGSIIATDFSYSESSHFHVRKSHGMLRFKMILLVKSHIG